MIAREICDLTHGDLRAARLQGLREEKNQHGVVFWRHSNQETLQHATYSCVDTKSVCVQGGVAKVRDRPSGVSTLFAFSGGGALTPVS